MGNIWEKHKGRAVFKELFPSTRGNFPEDIKIELSARELQMLLSSINVNLYKLSKEDKPYLPKDGKKNANHVRQDILVSIATKIKGNIS